MKTVPMRWPNSEIQGQTASMSNLSSRNFIFLLGNSPSHSFIAVAAANQCGEMWPHDELKHQKEATDSYPEKSGEFSYRHEKPRKDASVFTLQLCKILWKQMEDAPWAWWHVSMLQVLAGLETMGRRCLPSNNRLPAFAATCSPPPPLPPLPPWLPAPSNNNRERLRRVAWEREGRTWRRRESEWEKRKKGRARPKEVC